MDLVVEKRAEAPPEVAGEGADFCPDHWSVKAEKVLGIRAGLDDPEVVFANEEEGAEWLDRSGQMDLLTLAVRQIGIAEAWNRLGA